MALLPVQPRALLVAAAATVKSARVNKYNKLETQQELSSLVGLASGSDNETVQCVALILVCEGGNVPLRIVHCLLEKAVFEKNPSSSVRLFAAMMDCLRITRQYENLCQVGQCCVETLVPRLLSKEQHLVPDLEQAYVSIVARVLIASSDTSVSIMMRVAELCTNSIQQASPLLLHTLHDVLVLFTERMEVLQVDGSVDSYIPLVDQAQIDQLRRAYSWILPETSAQSLDFPWPEGKWRLEGESNQGKIPEFSLIASSRASASHKVKSLIHAHCQRDQVSKPTLSGRVLYEKLTTDTENQLELTSGTSLLTMPWNFVGHVSPPKGSTASASPTTFNSLGCGNSLSGVSYQGSASHGVLGRRISTVESLAFGVGVPNQTFFPAAANPTPICFQHYLTMTTNSQTTYPWLDTTATFATSHDQPFTWQAWILPKAPSTDLREMCKYPKTIMANGNYALQVEYSVPSFNEYTISLKRCGKNSEASLSSQVIQLDESFTQVTVTSNGTELQLHVNGQVSAAETSGNGTRNIPIDTTTPLMIGASPKRTSFTDLDEPMHDSIRVDPSSHFYGHICEVRVWKVCLDNDEICKRQILHGADLLRSNDSLRGYWPLLYSTLAPEQVLRDISWGKTPNHHAVLRWATVHDLAHQPTTDPNLPPLRGSLSLPHDQMNTTKKLLEPVSCPLKGHLEILGQFAAGGRVGLPIEDLSSSHAPSEVLHALPISLGTSQGEPGCLWSREQLVVYGGFKTSLDLAFLPDCNEMEFTLWFCKGTWYDLNVVGCNHAARRQIGSATPESRLSFRSDAASAIGDQVQSALADASVAISIWARMSDEHNALLVSTSVTVTDQGGGQGPSSILGIAKSEKSTPSHVSEVHNVVLCPLNALQVDPTTGTSRFAICLEQGPDEHLNLSVTSPAPDNEDDSTVTNLLHNCRCNIADMLHLQYDEPLNSVFFGLSVGACGTDIKQACPGLQLMELRASGIQGERKPIQQSTSSDVEPVAGTRDVGDPPLIPVEDEANLPWTCVCTTVNPPDYNFCTVCDTRRPRTGDATNQSNETWKCETCTCENDSARTRCIACDRDRPGFVTETPASSTSEAGAAWNCLTCTFKNPAGTSICGACATPKPVTEIGLTSTPATANTVHVDGVTSQLAEQIVVDAQESIMDSRIGPLRKILEQEVSRDPISHIQNMCDGAINKSAADLVATSNGLLVNGTAVFWDTTFGGSFRLESIGDEENEIASEAVDTRCIASDCDTPCFLLTGVYGNNNCAQITATASLEEDGWQVKGVWDQWCRDVPNDITRLGGHLFEFSLRNQDKIDGKWWYGSGLSGEWKGARVPDASLVRGIHTAVPPTKTELGMGVIARMSAVAAASNPRSTNKVKSALSPFKTGLVNMEEGLTNVCYQNSLLQCFFATRQFRNLVLRTTTTTSRSATPVATHTPEELAMLAAFSDVAMDGVNAFADDNQEIQDVAGFFNQLKLVFANLLLSQSPRFATNKLQKLLPSAWTAGRQMDVSDFCHLVMKASEEAVETNSSQSCNPVTDLFSCDVAQVMRCTKCGKTKSNFEQAMGLAVPLPRLYTPITAITAVVCLPLADATDLSVPEGYERIQVNLNHGKLDKPRVYLCVQRDPNGVPITELSIRAVPNAGFAPAPPHGYVAVGVNLNPDPVNETNPTTTPQPTRADAVYMYYKNDAKGSPITDIRLLTGDDQEAPSGYRLVNVNLNPKVALFPNQSTATGTAVENSTHSRGLGFDSPVKLCYRRGMPLTDIAIGARPPSDGSDYHLVDTPLNIALSDEEHSQDEVFLWSTDSSGKPPLTGLMLVDESAVEALIASRRPGVIEQCHGAWFVPQLPGGQRRCLLKERGEGCPITQVSVFRAPQRRSRYKNPEVCELLPPKTGSDLLSTALKDSRWLPATGVSTMPPAGLLEARGNELRFELVAAAAAATGAPSDQVASVQAVMVMGSCEQLPHAKLGGVAIRRDNTSPWLFYGRLDQQLSKAAATSISDTVTGTTSAKKGTVVLDFVQFVLSEGSTKLSGFRADTTLRPPKRVKVSGSRVPHIVAEPLRPIVDVSLIREGEDVPIGYEMLTTPSGSNRERLNINMDSGGRAAYIVFRRATSDAELPVIDVKLFIAELEPPPEGFKVIEKSLAGHSADLNLETSGSAMYVCLKYATKESMSNPSLNVVYDMQLQWKDKGDEPDPGFKNIRYSASLATEANLCMGGNHTLFLCTKSSRLLPNAVPLVDVNGVYDTDLFGLVTLYAVSEPSNAFVATGSLKMNMSSNPGNNTISTPPIDGVLMKRPTVEVFDRISGSKSLFAKSDEKKKKTNNNDSEVDQYVLFGFWKNTKISTQLQTFCIIEFDDDLRTALAHWSWALTSGTVEFVKDDYLEIAPTMDYGEHWSAGRLGYSDRCSDNSIQSIVNRFCSTTLLGGANRPECDSVSCAQAKQTHEQHTVVVHPPRFLQVSVKRMGFDWKNNRPVKELVPTPFETILEIPEIPSDLRDAIASATDAKAQRKENTRTYGLYAVVVHAGQNANSGHYFSYCRDSNATDLWTRDSVLSPWILFNDTRVSKCTWNEMVSGILNSDVNSTYLLFYRELSVTEVSAWKNNDEGTTTAVQSIKVDRMESFVPQVAEAEVDEDDEEAMLQLALALSREQSLSDVSQNDSAVHDGFNRDNVVRDLQALAGLRSKVPDWFHQVEAKNEELVLHRIQAWSGNHFRKVLTVQCLQSLLEDNERGEVVTGEVVP